MLKKLILSLLLIICHSAFAQTYFELRSQAELAGLKQDFHQATYLYQQGFKKHATNRRDFYNAACFASKANNVNQAFEWLEKAIQFGYQDIEHLKTDVDLLKLHDDPRWEKLISSLARNIALAEEKFDTPLKKELLQIFQDDQSIRVQVGEVFKKFGQGSSQLREIEERMIAIDQINLRKIIAIIERFGWVSPAQVGRQASNSLFVVIQHADLDIQKQYLPQIREAVKHPQADKAWLAYIEDRIAIREGRKQLYGTQLWSAAGKLDHTSLEDPENIDDRRAKLGLHSLAESLRSKKAQTSLPR